ncbi:MAG: hypothetical protein KF814_02915 [Nitrospiraceae bacterium]|nr:hypothetical protein [Nitrospiraceae bacterium]
MRTALPDEKEEDQIEVIIRWREEERLRGMGQRSSKLVRHELSFNIVTRGRRPKLAELARK